MRQTLLNHFLKIDWMMIAAISLSFPVIAMTSLFDNRLPGTADAYLHLLRLINAAVNLNDGVVIPRWGPQLHLGFGYPLGNFYAPGWHIAGGMLMLVGIPAVTVWLIFQSLGLVLYPLGGYLFSRLFTDRIGSLLGAAAFLFIPIRFFEVFKQGNISQLMAMALIVWVLWALARCVLSPGSGRIVVAAILIAMLLMSHHPTSAYAIPFAALYVSVVLWFVPVVKSRLRQIMAVALAFGLGLLLSGVYWLPALVEVQHVNVHSATVQYQIAENFIPLSDLIGPIVSPDHTAQNVPFKFSIGRLALTLSIVGGLLALIPRFKVSAWLRLHIIGGVIVMMIMLYLMTYRSLWIWEAIPNASLILFPWRLMSVIAVTMVPAITFVTSLIPLRWRVWMVILLISGLFISMLPLMFPIYDNEPDSGTITPATGIRYEITSGNLGAVANNEYLPIWISERPDWDACPTCYENWDWQVFPNERSLPDDVTVQAVSSDRKLSSAFEITTAEVFLFELHQMYFPGWQASIDGQLVDIQLTEPHGLLAVEVPEGFHEVEFWYAGTRTQHIGDALSILGLLIASILTVLHIRRNRSRQPASVLSEQKIQSRVGVVITVILCVSAVILRFIILPYTDWFRHESNISSPVGMEQHTGLIFEDDNGIPMIELMGYKLSQDEAHYGDWIFVDLYWRALTPMEESWQVKLALSDSWTLEEIDFSHHGAPGGLAMQHWTTEQYVLDSHILRLDSPAPYVYDLVVQVFNEEGQHLFATGSKYVRLASLPIIEKGDSALPENSESVDIVFGDWLRLRAYEWSSRQDKVQLRLFWEVLQAPNQDFALMLHFQSEGQTIGNADQPPIPSYPTQLWREGQYLESKIDLELPPETNALALGIYDRKTVQRVSVVRFDDSLEIRDNSLVLHPPTDD